MKRLIPYAGYDPKDNRGPPKRLRDREAREFTCLGCGETRLTWQPSTKFCSRICWRRFNEYPQRRPH